VQRLLFLPFSLAAGLIGGRLARRVFTAVWRLIDRDEPPQAQRRDVSTLKLLFALALQGAVVAAVTGGIDHLARRLFMHLTGSWPGERREADRDTRS
jgi:hypothetical protein